MQVTDIIFGILGGLSLFIYGIHLMGDGLQKAAGDGLRNILKKLTSTPLLGAIVGAAITSIVQSSSATSVMVVGFVNAGLMNLTQSIGVILGANVGTTVTSQIIAFKLTTYALPILTLGFVLNFLCKKRFWKFFGLFLFGLGLLFLGLKLMTGVVKPLGESEAVKQIFVNFSHNAFLGVMVGAVMTAVFQSSSVTTGLVLALAAVGLLDLSGAIPIILGCNIGTCITAILASIGTSVSARRVAVAHVMFNVLGSLLFIVLLGPYKFFIAKTSSDLLRQCANAHTFFNVFNTVLFLPLAGLYAKLITKLVPGKDVIFDWEPRYLEKHLLASPLVAFDASTKEIVQMARLSKEMVADSMDGFLNGNTRALAQISKKEAALDNLQTAVTDYLIELTQKNLTRQESIKIPPMLHSVNDLERIGDHSENLAELAQRKIDKKLIFSKEAIVELRGVYFLVNEMIDKTITALNTNSHDDAAKVLVIEDKINKLTISLRNNHIQRLNDGKCKVMSGIVFLDVISNFEKMGDHLTNVAQAVQKGLQWKARESSI
ncbi:MAG TPA: Na/Pi cotransporter family protein [Candidatus Omnitrophica bacterium]|nr:Na/Pi cotransporter family protein [Candidatus Omnitrophota bacterium]